LNDHVAVVVSPDELRALSEAHRLLPESHPLYHSIGLRIVTASLTAPSASHWVTIQARSEAMRSVLREIDPSVPSVAGVPVAMSASADAQVAWAGFVRRLSAVLSPLDGMSVEALVSELRRRVFFLEGELAAAKIAPLTAVAQPVLDEALSRAEAALKAAHDHLTAAGIPYHPDLVERMKSSTTGGSCG
jgi:hypothetical protein